MTLAYVQRRIGKLAHGERPTLLTVLSDGVGWNRRTHTGTFVRATVLSEADRRAALLAADRPTLVAYARAMGQGKGWTNRPIAMVA